MAASWRRLSFGAIRTIARGFELAGRGLVHVGAGLLAPAEARDVSMERWQDFGSSDQFIDSGFLPFEQAMYLRFLRKEDAILVAGCGSGRDLVALLRAGFTLEGLEPARRAALRAQAAVLARGLHARVAVGRVEDTPLTTTWDAVILSWFLYSYVLDRAARIALLARLRSHLRPGGRIFVSYIIEDHPPRRLPLAITSLVGRLSRSRWQLEPGDILRSEGGLLHYEHHFRPGEFTTEIRAAGLDVLFLEDEIEGHAVLVVRA